MTQPSFNPTDLRIGVASASVTTSAMPPNCTSAQGMTLPVSWNTSAESRPAVSTNQAAGQPARWLTRSQTATPIRPAKATAMPARSAASRGASGTR